MKWHKLNSANKTLLIAMVAFCLSLCLHLQYENSILAKGLLFVSEASLVGGIADWFAITALFEKPLGFPWHTAILPRRRESFIEATVKMLEREFFGKKALLRRLRGVDFVAKFLLWLDKAEHRAYIVEKAAELISENISKAVPSIIENIRKKGNLALEEGSLFQELGQGIAQGKKGSQLFTSLFSALEAKADSPEFRQMVYENLDNYQKSKLQGAMSMMLMLAKSMDILNIEEATEIICHRLKELCKELQEETSPKRELLLLNVGKIFSICGKNPLIKQELKTVLWNTSNNADICIILQKEVIEQESFQHLLQDILKELLEGIILRFRENTAFRHRVNAMCYIFLARAVLQAQGMIGTIVRDVLHNMTDKQISRLIYEKAEPDFLWIRMNGSIVGGSIGGILFILLQVLQAKGII